MNRPSRLALCAVLLCAGVWSGCAARSEAPPGPTSDTPQLPDTCQVDQDCPDPGLFFCDSASARCQAACRSQEDCTADKRGVFHIPECDANPLGCRCDNSRCVQALCSADVECAASGRVCRDGQCVSPPAEGAVASCQLVPDSVVGRQGVTVRFSVLARDAAGAPVVPASVEWTALESGVRVEASDALGASVVLTEPSSGALEQVQARLGGVTCVARVRVLDAAVESGWLRAVVTDEQTGRPLGGAGVVVADAAGQVTGSATTDAGGVALLAAPTGAGSLSVFHADFDYLTVAHAGATGPLDVSLPLRRNPTDKYGGTQGQVLGVSTSQDLHTGLVGLSAPDAVSELPGALLEGPSRQVGYTLEGQSREATLAAGTYVVLPGSTLAVTDVSARGLAGVCDVDPGGGADPEVAMARGTCGTRTAWLLGGDVPLALLPLAAGGALDVGQLLAQTVPLLRTFRSSVVRDVRFSLRDTPSASTGAPDLHDASFFTRVDPELTAGRSMPLGFQFALRVPALPRYRSTWMDSLAVLGSVRVAGQGVVPLGLGAGTNTSPTDANTDTQPGLPGPGLVSVRMAPAHHGLEGAPYELLLTASSSTAADDLGAGAASSALIHRGLGTLPFDPKGLAPVAVAGPFLSVPEGSRYNYTSTPASGLSGRQWRFTTAPALPTATALRASFTTLTGHRWSVWMDVSQAVSGLRLPVPPSPLEDRTYFGDVSGSRAPYTVQALALRQAGSATGEALTVSALLAARGVDLSQLAAVTAAWSELDYGRALVRWTVPSTDDQRVSPGARVQVQVSAFQVGSGLEDEGSVRLTFVGGTGCEGQQVNGFVTDARGKVDLTLPGGCSGTDVRLVATLVDPGGTAIQPAVTSTRSLTIAP